MVCFLHSVTTGSRDRANVSLIIIIREKVLRICVSREGSQNMFFILGQHG